MNERQKAIRAAVIQSLESTVMPVVVIDMEGGAIHNVTTSVPMRVIFLDQDTEGADEDGIGIIDGHKVYVINWPTESAGVNPDFTRQIEEEVEPVLQRQTASELSASTPKTLQQRKDLLASQGFEVEKSDPVAGYPAGWNWWHSESATCSEDFLSEEEAIANAELSVQEGKQFEDGT